MINGLYDMYKWKKQYIDLEKHWHLKDEQHMDCRESLSGLLQNLNLPAN